MNLLRQALEKYLRLRRALGFELYRPGKALDRFVSFAEQEGAAWITTALALRWARLPQRVDPSTWTNRLGLVRRFARFCSTLDSRTEVPPDGLLPHRFRRKAPYIWSTAEVKALLNLTHRMRSKLGLRRFTYETFFGLVASAGLRISEALHLDNADIDWRTGVLTIRNTKFEKTRHVPVHGSTIGALQRYARRRDRLLSVRDQEAYFVTEQGSRLSQSAVGWVYQSLRRSLTFKTRDGQRPPRIHDLRHTFAVDTVRRWYRADRDVEAWLPWLATYIGHAHVNDTYWYLSAVPDLLSSAARRLERVNCRHTP